MNQLPFQKSPTKSAITKEYQYRLMYFMLLYGGETTVYDVLKAEANKKA